MLGSKDVCLILNEVMCLSNALGETLHTVIMQATMFCGNWCGAGSGSSLELRTGCILLLEHLLLRYSSIAGLLQFKD